MNGGYLWARHVGTLLGILACMHEGAALSPRATVTRDDDGAVVLTFDPQFGLLGKAAGEDAFSINVLRHLSANQWIVGRRAGSLMELRLGPRGRRVMDAIPTKRKEAAA